MGFGNLGGDFAFALLQALGDRPPGELVEDRQHHEEDHGGPEGQIAAEIIAVGVDGIECVGAPFGSQSGAAMPISTTQVKTATAVSRVTMIVPR